MQRVLERHREGIVTQQVAGGKSFAGCPFYSKPDVIHFKVSLAYQSPPPPPGTEVTQPTLIVMLDALYRCDMMCNVNKMR